MASMACCVQIVPKSSVWDLIWHLGLQTRLFSEGQSQRVKESWYKSTRNQTQAEIEYKETSFPAHMCRECGVHLDGIQGQSETRLSPGSSMRIGSSVTRVTPISVKTQSQYWASPSADDSQIARYYCRCQYKISRSMCVGHSRGQVKLLLLASFPRGRDLSSCAFTTVLRNVTREFRLFILEFGGDVEFHTEFRTQPAQECHSGQHSNTMSGAAMECAAPTGYNSLMIILIWLKAVRDSTLCGVAMRCPVPS
eukprot:2521453-Rhodomonas_salina.3